MPVTRLRQQLYWTETVVGLTAGVVSGLRGLSYLPPVEPDRISSSLSALADAPEVVLIVHALLWLAVLPLSVAAIWARRLWVPTIAAVASLCAATGAIALASWLVAGFDRGWVSALSYWLLAILIGGIARLAAIAEGLATVTEPRGQ